MTSNAASESYFFQSGHLATLKSPLHEVRFLYGLEACISNIIDSHSACVSRLLRVDQQRSVIGHTLEPARAYSAYGFSRPTEDSLSLGFSGERLGSEGLYLLGNGYRAYNPGLMRFHSADSFSPFGRGGINAYAYCSNDPVNRVDPDGHAYVFTWNWFRSKKSIINRRQKVIDDLAPTVSENLSRIKEEERLQRGGHDLQRQRTIKTLKAETQEAISTIETKRKRLEKIDKEYTLKPDLQANINAFYELQDLIKEEQRQVANQKERAKIRGLGKALSNNPTRHRDLNQDIQDIRT